MSEPLLVCDRLTRRFGALEAVRELSLEVGAGEVYGLLGPNGAGKTTTLRMLVGLLHPSGGSARIAGHDIVSEDLQVRRVLGYMPEFPVLLDAMDLASFLAFVGDLRGLSRADLDRRATELVARLGLTESLGEPVGTGSFGTRKKMLLAGILLHEPLVLLLDEPTAGLDPGSAAAVHGLLSEAAGRGAAVLVSTHLLESAERLCHRIGVVHRGRLVAEGTPSELMAGRGGKDLTEVFLELTARAAAPEG
jgi:ABC-2 type transport system ATP-binding protein